MEALSIDSPLIKDFSEFSGLPAEEVLKNIFNFKALTAAEWNNLRVKTYNEKAVEFYRSSNYYIFDLLSANYSKQALTGKLNYFNPEILRLLKDCSGKAFLDFGGGTGLMCELATELGKTATYLDIPSKVFDFARWRFRKYNLPINVIVSDPQQLVIKDSYDIIYSDAVIEHLIDPGGTVMALCERVRPSGLLILLVDLSGHTPNMPMHRDIDIAALHRTVRAKRFKPLFGANEFCSVWQRSA